MANKFPTIGVAGVTIPGAADCLNKINQSFKHYFKGRQHPPIMVQQPNFGPIHDAQLEDKWDIVEDHLVTTINALASAGADFAIIPANTVHKVINGIQQRTSIPVLNMLEIIANECKRNGLKKVCVLGTRWTMAGHLYKTEFEKRGIQEQLPSALDQELIQSILFEELIPTGKITDGSLSALLEVISRIKCNGCDGIALACTELPLVLNQTNCGITTIDTTGVLAEAAVGFAFGLM